MTLVLALACKNGIVFAADSQGQEDTGVRRIVEKIRVDDASGLIWAGTGDQGLLQALDVSVKEVTGTVTRLKGQSDRIRDLLLKAVSARMKEQVQHLVVPLQSQPEVLNARVLFAAFHSRPFLLEVECLGKATDYTDGAFHAIGSGGAVAQVAQAMLNHHDLKTMEIEIAKVVAFRVMSSAIDTLAGGIGYPVRMVIATDASRPVKLSSAEVDALKVTVDMWKQTERDALSGLYPQPGPVAGAPGIAARPGGNGSSTPPAGPAAEKQT